MSHEEGENTVCLCGHTARWHSHYGRGVCEYGEPCECERFAVDDELSDQVDPDRIRDERYQR